MSNIVVPAGPSVQVLDQIVTNDYAIYHGDCVDVMRGLPSDSIHYSIYSVPFRSIYTYSASPRDLGNTTSDTEFAEHYQYCIRETQRVLKPGRLVSVHCMNLPTSKARDGYIGLSDFRGEIIRTHIGNDAAELYDASVKLERRARMAFGNGEGVRGGRLIESVETIRQELRDHPGDNGFIYHSEATIWKDPVTAMQRTKALGLLHKQLKKDSCMSRQGIPDYLVTMRKPGENAEPVANTNESFPVKEWQHMASPIWSDATFPKEDWQTEMALLRTADGKWVTPHDVWMDINPSDTLQYQSAREHKDERHVCPLQLEVIRRGVRMWSNRGDTVLSPFGGIGSEGHVSLEMGRRFVAAELKSSYFGQMGRNLAAVNRQPLLFASLNAPVIAPAVVALVEPFEPEEEPEEEVYDRAVDPTAPKEVPVVAPVVPAAPVKAVAGKRRAKR